MKWLGNHTIQWIIIVGSMILLIGGSFFAISALIEITSYKSKEYISECSKNSQSYQETTPIIATLCKDFKYFKFRFTGFKNCTSGGYADIIEYDCQGKLNDN